MCDPTGGALRQFYEPFITKALQRWSDLTLTPEQTSESLRLLKSIRLAGPKATFDEKQAILRLLDIQVLYDGERLQMVGSVPTRTVGLQRFLNDETTNDSSFHPLRDGFSTDSQAAEEGNSNSSCMRNMD